MAKSTSRCSTPCACASGMSSASASSSFSSSASESASRRFFASCFAFTAFRCLSDSLVQNAGRTKSPCSAWPQTLRGSGFQSLTGEVAPVLHGAIVLAMGLLKLHTHPVTFRKVRGAQESHDALVIASANVKSL